jgi:Raf kinase inhibitor-like YbhB/YbcL family protein
MLELHVSCPAFRHGSVMPIEHTGDGADIAPDLAWSPAPPGARGFSLLVEDPDAPDPDRPLHVRTHWIVTGIAPHVTALQGGVLPAGASAGTNDWGQRGWNGPECPIGRHRYVFHIYALDIALHAPGIDRVRLLGAIDTHVLAHGKLVGTYGRLKLAGDTASTV